jgi:hypothetical protein
MAHSLPGRHGSAYWDTPAKMTIHNLRFPGGYDAPDHAPHLGVSRCRHHQARHPRQWTRTLHMVVASAAKQSRVFPLTDSGLPRCARNDGARCIGVILQLAS